MKRKMLKIVTISLLAVAMIAGPASQMASAHCQVPCGIFGDETRFTSLSEHIVTMEKAMNQINALSEDPAPNVNQLVRWVTTKEDHANEFAEVVTKYFLQQRIKLNEADSNEEAYLNKLSLCHQLLVGAMKCKQTTDTATTDALKKTLKEFEDAYFTEADKKHLSLHLNGHDETEHQSRQELPRS